MAPAAQPDTLDISSRHYYWKLRLAFSKAIELRAYQQLAREENLSQAKDVLDLGCSDGVFTRMLGEAVGLPTPRVGGDFDAGALGDARLARAHRSAVRLDAARLPFAPERFDLVLANGVLAHLRPGPEAALREVRRVLRPAGRFVFSVPTQCHADFYWSVLALERLGLHGLARARRRHVNANEGYTTLLSPHDWRSAAERAGLAVSRCLAYSGRAVGWRRSLLGTPLLRMAGALRLVPGEAPRRAFAALVRRALRAPVDARLAETVRTDEADYVLFVASKDSACAR